MSAFDWRTATFAMVVAGTTAMTLASPPPDSRHLTHTRHHQPHHEDHPAAHDPDRFMTNRASPVELPLPAETPSFSFVVFGDRTGGPVDGVDVLADAVRDVNLLEPDLVMTVGDLIEGYNTTPDWMWQMREFKSVMDRLLCPWFPVAGNHDIYWRGPGRPAGEHEQHYELHFGPLWYAFEHKDCWFVALYSDEGNPVTGERSINKPASQTMSDEQLAWLDEILTRTRDAAHVFLFIHHPRWRGGGYGDDWERVHPRLVAAGNVSAVFAGHIHQMRYRERDGIEYVTLATVGGHQPGIVPRVGYLHHYNIVTVREGQVGMTAVPVGAAIDPRAITDALADAAVALRRTPPRFEGAIVVRDDGSDAGGFAATVANPTPYEIDLTVRVESGDSRWHIEPDHVHAVLAPGVSRRSEFTLSRPAGPIDHAFRPVTLAVDIDLLTPTFRYEIPETRHVVPADLDAIDIPPSREEQVLRLDGRSGRAAVASSAFALPDGPFTLEAWFRARSFAARTGLVCKTESSEYGIFVAGGRPEFFVFLGDAYATASAAREPLAAGEWHHVAGVYDGGEVRIYVDGELAGRTAAQGPRRRNQLPFILGADVDGSGRPTSHFDGDLDAVRLSVGAMYAGPRFIPERRLTATAETVLLYNMDGPVGPWLYDEARPRAPALVEGGAVVVGE